MVDRIDIQSIERDIVRTCIAELIDAGFELFVDRTETCEGSVPITVEDHEEVFACDEEHIYCRRKADDSKMISGFVYLVFGNDGWDVISDYTVNLEQHLAKTLALVDKYDS